LYAGIVLKVFRLIVGRPGFNSLAKSDKKRLFKVVFTALLDVLALPHKNVICNALDRGAEAQNIFLFF